MSNIPRTWALTASAIRQHEPPANVQGCPRACPLGQLRYAALRVGALTSGFSWLTCSVSCLTGDWVNTAYLVIDQKENIAAAVDPAEPQKVLAAAEKEGVPIKAIYTTHHHGYGRFQSKGQMQC